MAVTWEFTDKIKYLNKGTAKKEEADILAKQFNVTGTEHAKDALHLGVLAGYVK